MNKRLLAGLVLSAACGVLASVGMASASTLHVDGGIIQHWELPAHVEDLTSEGTGDPALDPEAQPGSADTPAAPSDPADPTPHVREPTAPGDAPVDPSTPDGGDAPGGTGSTDDPPLTSPDVPGDGPADAHGGEPGDAAPTTAAP